MRFPTLLFPAMSVSCCSLCRKTKGKKCSEKYHKVSWPRKAAGRA
ncbi:hypothetical protein DESPIGER_1825 [Desulfovibrio piger]|uniref:Uncharacterized protein n=1 Tax=Desulfovibrio piger TaxID=901 RepID=A0A1K1LJJ7_9BACT|nr:hypothetical protein DESPIGER_1825 [Desulfovibrio piger]